MPGQMPIPGIHNQAIMDRFNADPMNALLPLLASRGTQGLMLSNPVTAPFAIPAGMAAGGIAGDMTKPPVLPPEMGKPTVGSALTNNTNPAVAGLGASGVEAVKALGTEGATPPTAGVTPPIDTKTPPASDSSNLWGSALEALARVSSQPRPTPPGIGRLGGSGSRAPSPLASNPVNQLGQPARRPQMNLGQALLARR